MPDNIYASNILCRNKKKKKVDTLQYCSKVLDVKPNMVTETLSLVVASLTIIHDS